MNRNFLTISVDEWQQNVSAYLDTSKNVLNKYLQSYPFSVLNKEEKTILKSKKFFDSYISNCAFLNDEELKLCKTVMTKKDGNFREITISSPIIFLLLNVLGAHLYEESKEKLFHYKNKNISSFYAGNYKEKSFHYSDSYKSFINEIENKKSKYRYCFKTDISQFYPSINLDLLMNTIQDKCPGENNNSTLLYKNLLLYLGNGRYPTIPNNTGLSFISTELYLDNFDEEIFSNLSKVSEISKFYLIRYVDDLYILFTCGENEKNKCEQHIKQIIQDAAFKNQLTVNTAKQKLTDIIDMNHYVMNSLDYIDSDDFLTESNFKLSYEITEEKLIELLDNLLSLENFPSREEVESEMRCTLLDKLDVEVPDATYFEILKFLVYTKQELFRSKKVISKLKEVIQNLDIVQYYPKIFVLMILNTRDEKLIKNFLNYLFNKYREKPFSKYYEVMSLTYSISRNFCHDDLIRNIGYINEGIKSFIYKYCKKTSMNKYIDEKIINDQSHKFQKMMFNDDILNYLRLMKLYMHKKKDFIEEFGYHKVYFDRKLAYMAAELGINGATKKGKPTFNFTYNKGCIEKIKVEADCKFDDLLIKNVKKSYELRNSNPIVHASAEIITKNKKSDVLQKMKSLDEFLKMLSEKIWN